MRHGAGSGGVADVTIDKIAPGTGLAFEPAELGSVGSGPGPTDIEVCGRGLVVVGGSRSIVIRSPVRLIEDNWRPLGHG